MPGWLLWWQSWSARTETVAIKIPGGGPTPAQTWTPLIPVTVPELLRLLRDTVIPPPRRDRGPPAALVGLATPPPAPRPPSPPTFLDIGTGLPAADNKHEVAQSAAPECRVMYEDNDPVVLSHAKALLASGPDGTTAYVDADLRDPETILAAAAEVLDFSRPVAVMLVAILQHISDQDDPYGIVARLAAGMPSGSYLTLSHPARDIQATAMAEIAGVGHKS